MTSHGPSGSSGAASGVSAKISDLRSILLVFNEIAAVLVKINCELMDKFICFFNSQKIY